MEEDLAREIFYQKKIKEQENSTEILINFFLKQEDFQVAII